MTKPAETISNIPQAARKQIKEANRLIAELNAKPGETPNLTAASRPGFERAAPSATAQPSTAPAEPGPESKPVPPAEDPVKALEHKYSVLAGKYNAETARLMGRAEQLAADNAVLLARLQQQPAAPAAPARAEDRFDLSAVSAKEREEYGEELVTLMARIAKANSSAEVERLSRELASMKSAVQQTSQIGAETRMEKVWTQLDAKIPNWRMINNSQQFVDWLQNIDIMSGKPRQAGLTEAFEAGDGPRVVGIFSRFVQEDSSSRPTELEAAPAAHVDRSTLVAPSAGRGGSQEAPNGSSGRIWSEQEINDFYSRVQRGRISAEEKKATEAEIMAAVTAGRVQPTRDERHLANSR